MARWDDPAAQLKASLEHYYFTEDLQISEPTPINWKWQTVKNPENHAHYDPLTKTIVAFWKGAGFHFFIDEKHWIYNNRARRRSETGLRASRSPRGGTWRNRRIQ